MFSQNYNVNSESQRFPFSAHQLRAIVLGCVILSLFFPAHNAASADVKVAFIGNQGIDEDARSVLQLVADEGVDLLLIQGNLGYLNGASISWENNLRNLLAIDFPVLVVAGNHEKSEWPDYQKLISTRIDRIDELTCIGDYGIKAVCSFRGLDIVQVAPDISNIEDVLPDDDYADFIQQSLAESEAAWRICSWNRNERLPHAGVETEKNERSVYQACLNAGAIIATGQEHAYSRTHLMSDFENLEIAHKSDHLEIDQGQTFAFVSGLGGKGIRHRELAGEWWAAEFSGAQSASFGALFCTFGDTEATCYFKDITGAVPDSFTLESRVGLAEPPVLSISVAEEPEVTETEVTETEVTETEVTETEVTETEVTETEVTETEVTEPEVAESQVTKPEVAELEVTKSEETTSAISDSDASDADVTNSVVYVPLLYNPTAIDPPTIDPAPIESPVFSPAAPTPPIHQAVYIPATSESSTLDQTLVEPAIGESVETEPVITESVLIETILSTKLESESNEAEPFVLEPLTAQEFSVTNASKIMPSASESVETESSVIEPFVTGPYMTEPTMVKAFGIAPSVIESLEFEVYETKSFVTEPSEIKPLVIKPFATGPYMTKPLMTKSFETSPSVIDSYEFELYGTKSFATEPSVKESYVTDPYVTESFMTDSFGTASPVFESYEFGRQATQPFVIELAATEKPMSEPYAISPLVRGPSVPETYAVTSAAAKPVAVTPVTPVTSTGSFSLFIFFPGLLLIGLRFIAVLKLKRDHSNKQRYCVPTRLCTCV